MAKKRKYLSMQSMTFAAAFQDFIRNFYYKEATITYFLSHYLL